MVDLPNSSLASGPVTRDDKQLSLDFPQISRLYTVQDQPAVNYLLKHGFFKGDMRYVCHDFRPAYRWLMKQRDYRHAPVWYWPKLDLEGFFGGWSEGEYLLITADVPASSVTLMDFAEWHFVLNANFLCLDEDEWGWNVVTKPSLSMIETSWEKIFDPSLRRDHEWLGDPLFQATTERLELEHVVSIDRFVIPPDCPESED